MEDYPGIVGIIIGIITGVCVWIYAISQWGLLLGLAFGWFPAIIAATIAYFIWPVFLIIIGIFIIILLLNR